MRWVCVAENEYRCEIAGVGSAWAFSPHGGHFGWVASFTNEDAWDEWEEGDLDSLESAKAAAYSYLDVKRTRIGNALAAGEQRIDEE